jgi:hypothetical protein
MLPPACGAGNPFSPGGAVHRRFFARLLAAPPSTQPAAAGRSVRSPTVRCLSPSYETVIRKRARFTHATNRRHACSGGASGTSALPGARARFLVEVPASIIERLIFSFGYLRFDQRSDLHAIMAALDRAGYKPNAVRVDCQRPFSFHME